MNQSFALSFNEPKCFKNPILQNIQKWAYKILYSNWFFIVMAFTMVLSWSLGIVEIAFVFVAIVSTITWFFMDDISPFIACFFCIPYIFPLDIHVENYFHIIPILVPVVIGVIFHIFYFSPKKFIKGKYLYPQIAVTIALIIGGLGSNATPDQYAHGLGQIVQLGPLLLLIYMAMANYMLVRGEDQSVYFSKMFLATSLVLTVEIFIFAIKNWIILGNGEELDLGIVNGNGASTIVMMCLPFSFYMIFKRPRYVISLSIFILLQYIAILFTTSRGGILFGTIVMLASLIYTLVKSPKRKQLGIFVVVVIAIAAIIAIIFREKIGAVITELIDHLNNYNSDELGSGRFLIWQNGLEQFAKYPAFGVCIGYVGVRYVPGLSGNYWFHSTIIQVIACTGIAGTLLYIYNYYQRFKIVIKGMKKNMFKVFILFGMLGFEGYSLINNGTFLAIPAMLTVTVMTFMCERTDSYLDYLEGNI